MTEFSMRAVGFVGLGNIGKPMALRLAASGQQLWVYDVAPDGTKVLKNRLISPMRVADVTKPVTVNLPGIVHRFGTGHHIQVVVAASDFAYAGNTVAQPVTISTSPLSPSTLALPLTSKLAF